MSLNTNPFSKEKGFSEKGCAETILKRVYGNKGDETGKVREMVEETDGLRNVGLAMMRSMVTLGIKTESNQKLRTP